MVLGVRDRRLPSRTGRLLLLEVRPVRSGLGDPAMADARTRVAVDLAEANGFLLHHPVEPHRDVDQAEAQPALPNRLRHGRRASRESVSGWAPVVKVADRSQRLGSALQAL